MIDSLCFMVNTDILNTVFTLDIQLNCMHQQALLGSIHFQQFSKNSVSQSLGKYFREPSLESIAEDLVKLSQFL